MYTIPDTTSWHYVVATAAGNSGADQALYVDGIQRTSWTKTTPQQDSTTISIGDGNFGRPHNGQLDECRIATATRSPEWIWAEYYNQVSPTTFAVYAAVPEPAAAALFAIACSLLGRRAGPCLSRA